MPPQPANFGTGNGVLGVLPASGARASRRLAGDGLCRSQAANAPQAIQQNGAIKPVAAHTGWIIQVGALESESEAGNGSRRRAIRPMACWQGRSVHRGGHRQGRQKLFRARFAGLDRDQAEAVCRTLKRSEISCITVRN